MFSHLSDPGKLQKLALPAALAMLLIPIALIEFAILRKTHGDWCYPIDDAFIHLAVAKNLALNGNWGISAHEFASASSSILYTLLLAALFRIFSVHTIIPFLVNATAAVALLILAQNKLRKAGIDARGQLLILTAITWLTPLPILVVTGMEHTLQCLLSLIFLIRFSEWIEPAPKTATGEQPFQPLPVSLVLYGTLCCLVRYEGIFLVGTACLLLLFRRRPLASFQLGVLSSLPWILFGLYSVSRGGYFLPNPVLLKAGTSFLPGNIGAYLSDTFLKKLILSPAGAATAATQHLLVILPLAALFFAQKIRQSPSPSYEIGLILMITSAFLQIAIADTGWFYRYEAWLICSSVFLVGLLLYKFRPAVGDVQKSNPIMAAALFSILALPLVLRSSGAFRKVNQACLNVYEQQAQMGAFLERYYEGQTVAIEDIGAVSYLMNGKPLDLNGLGNNKVAKAMIGNYASPGFLDSLCRREKAGIAIIFERSTPADLFGRWGKIGSWQIPNNLINGGDKVYFYAIEPGEAADLKKHLLEYSGHLPADVLVQFYTDK